MPRIPRPRFRLHTLLAVMTLLAIWLALHTRSAQQQSQAVRTLLEHGANVHYDYQYQPPNYSPETLDPEALSWVPPWLLETLGVDMFHRVVNVSFADSDVVSEEQDNAQSADDVLKYVVTLKSLRGLAVTMRQIDDAGLARLKSLTQLRELYFLDAPNITDAGIAHLAELSELRSVIVGSCKITDASLRVLGELPHLQSLYAGGCPLTDEGLRHLATSRRLKTLWLTGGKARFTDTGLSHIAKLPNLETLGIETNELSKGIPLPFVLGWTPTTADMTDAGVHQLSQATNLKSLSVLSSGVTPEGIQALQRKLPGLTCELYHAQVAGGGIGGFPRLYWQQVQIPQPAGS